MSEDSQQYALHWQGQESGPFSLGEIKHKVDRGEITLNHEILVNGQFVPLHDFFARKETEAQAAAEPEKAVVLEPEPIKTSGGRYTKRLLIALGSLLLLAGIWILWPRSKTPPARSTPVKASNTNSKPLLPPLVKKPQEQTTNTEESQAQQPQQPQQPIQPVQPTAGNTGAANNAPGSDASQSSPAAIPVTGNSTAESSFAKLSPQSASSDNRIETSHPHPQSDATNSPPNLESSGSARKTSQPELPKENVATSQPKVDPSHDSTNQSNEAVTTPPKPDTQPTTDTKDSASTKDETGNFPADKTAQSTADNPPSDSQKEATKEIDQQDSPTPLSSEQNLATPGSILSTPFTAVPAAIPSLKLSKPSDQPKPATDKKRAAAKQEPKQDSKPPKETTSDSPEDKTDPTSAEPSDAPADNASADNSKPADSQQKDTPNSTTPSIATEDSNPSKPASKPSPQNVAQAGLVRRFDNKQNSLKAKPAKGAAPSTSKTSPSASSKASKSESQSTQPNADPTPDSNAPEKSEGEKPAAPDQQPDSDDESQADSSPKKTKNNKSFNNSASAGESAKTTSKSSNNQRSQNNSASSDSPPSLDKNGPESNQPESNSSETDSSPSVESPAPMPAAEHSANSSRSSSLPQTTPPGSESLKLARFENPLESHPKHTKDEGFSRESDVVFLVDQSFSMRGQPATLAWQQLSNQLVQLNTNATFYILYFHSSGFDPMPSPSPLPATPENVHTMLQWGSTVRHVFGSDPGKAAARALDLYPRTLWVISDGKFPKSASTAITKSNKSVHAQVNTVDIRAHNGEDSLRLLAEKNGGIYQFIQADQDQKHKPIDPKR